MSTLKISAELSSFGQWQKIDRSAISQRLGKRSFSSMRRDNDFEIAVFNVTEETRQSVIDAIKELGVFVKADNLVM